MLHTIWFIVSAMDVIIKVQLFVLQIWCSVIIISAMDVIVKVQCCVLQSWVMCFIKFGVV